MAKAAFTFEQLGSSLKDTRLTEAGLKRFAASGTKVYCEPVLHGSVADPSGFATNLAGHGVVRGFFIRSDDRFDLWFSFRAVSGFNPGSGTWTMELPEGIAVATVATDIMYAELGSWHVHRPGTGAIVSGFVEAATSTTVQFVYANAGVRTLLSAAAPWALANLDQFAGHISLAVV